MVEKCWEMILKRKKSASSEGTVIMGEAKSGCYTVS